MAAVSVSTIVGSGVSFVKYPAETKCVIGTSPNVLRTASNASRPSGDKYAPSQSTVNATTMWPFLGARVGLDGEQRTTSAATRYAQMLKGMDYFPPILIHVSVFC